MRHELIASEYSTEHRTACLALFDSNVPQYFAESERSQYSTFLDDLPCRYLLLSSPRDGVVAAGGWYVTDEPKIGGLAWGLVDHARQHRGFGTELLRIRLRHLQASGVITVRVRTSPPARGFYEHAGFRLARVVSQGFAGSDLVELHLTMPQP